jgi:cysteinyl-tRNA synthetase
MNDDMNTPVMIAELFEGVRIINSVNDGKLMLTDAGIVRLKQLFDAMVFDVLGLKKEEGALRQAQGDNTMDGLVGEFIRMRAEAKARKDFATGDAIRDKLKGLGIELKDGKEGTTWERA